MVFLRWIHWRGITDSDVSYGLKLQEGTLFGISRFFRKTRTRLYISCEGAKKRVVLKKDYRGPKLGLGEQIFTTGMAEATVSSIRHHLSDDTGKVLLVFVEAVVRNQHEITMLIEHGDWEEG